MNFRRHSLLIFSVISLVSFFACRLSPDNTLTLQVKYDERGSRKTTAADQFDCYVVSATGSKLSSGLDGKLASCLALGKMSDVVSLETLRDKGVSLSVPAGEPIKLRLLGIEKRLTDSCSDLKLSKLLTSAGTEIYELGMEATTPYADSEIEITNTYSADSPALIGRCQEVAETAGLTLAHMFHGSALGTTEPDFIESVGFLPPKGPSGADLSSADPAAEIGINGTNFFSQNSSEFKRVDFLYSVSLRDLPDNVRAFRVKIAARGGAISSPSVCFGATDHGNGYRLEAVKNADWNHEDTEAITTEAHTEVGVQTLDLSPAMDYINSVGGEEFFHFSVRSRTPTQLGSRCSALKILSVDVVALTTVDRNK